MSDRDCTERRDVISWKRIFWTIMGEQKGISASVRKEITEEIAFMSMACMAEWGLFLTRQSFYNIPADK